MRYFFHPAAEAEHLGEVAYYESQRAGLGARYLQEVEAALSLICNAPHRYAVERPPDIRRYYLKQFPFTILFREVTSRVEVLAIAHKRIRPNYWVQGI